MREAFIEKKFNENHTKIIAIAKVIMAKYADLGYDLSLRQLYYQFVAKDLLPNKEQSYKMLGNVINDARLAGLLDWDIIVDRGRVLQRLAHWKTPSDIVGQSAKQFMLDRWENQPNYVEVMVEKQALEGVLEPVCDELDVPYMANKGYSSASSMWKAGKRYERKIREKKTVHVIYLGDHDPSGIDMTRDVTERVRMFAWSHSIQVHRIALNMDQIEELNPPENPAKMTDPRAGDYVDRFGEHSWELDAIEPNDLGNLIRNAVVNLRDDDLFHETIEREDSMKQRLEDVARELEDEENDV